MMKKLVVLSIFFSIMTGIIIAYACSIDDRDKYYNDCITKRKCGEKMECKTGCLNEANKWYYNGCK